MILGTGGTQAVLRLIYHLCAHVFSHSVHPFYSSRSWNPPSSLPKCPCHSSGSSSEVSPGGFPCGSAGKESAYNAGDLGLIPGLGRSSGEEDSYPFLGRKSMTNLDSILKSRDITLPTKICLVKAMVFPVVVYGYESWTIKKAEPWRTDAFELWCWRRLLRVP